MNGFILLFLEKICEAIYFSLFMIYGKNIKEKRLLFIGIMIFEYLMITSLIKYNIWLHIIYIFMTFLNLKVLYKDKAQITDVFLFMIASILLIILSIICGLFQIFFGIKYKILLIINRIIMFTILILLSKRINKIYKKFYSFWNRTNNNKAIKSLTLRNISVIIFNFMFYIINLCMIYAIYTMK